MPTLRKRLAAETSCNGEIEERVLKDIRNVIEIVDGF